MNRWIIWALGVVLTLSAAGCVDRQAQKESKATEQVINNPVKSVTVQPAVVAPLTESVEVTGDVTTSDDTTIGSKQNNRVVAVLVKDGDIVSKGQLLATLDDTAAQGQMQQARAQVATALASMSTARSQVAQAEHNLAVGPHRSTIAILLARAQVSASQKGLDKVVNGARPEERRQAVDNLESAKANLELQRKQLERTRALVAEGALAGQNLDQQQSAYDQAAAQVKSAQEAVNINVNGSRPEDIDTAKAQLQQAVESLRNAQDAKKLDPLLKDQLDAANAQVESARAQLESARAQIQIAGQAIQDARVYAPFSGRIAGRPIQAGTVAGNSTAIVHIVGSQGVYFNGQIPSNNIDKVHVGMPVTIHVDGLGDKSFTGSILGLDPMADSVGRLFSIRVQFKTVTPDLKPGMFARGSVAVRTVPSAVVVPAVAVQARGDDKYVYTVESGKAKQVKVTTGLTKGDYIQVTGLSEGSQVVVNGQEDLVDGVKVAVKGKTAALKEPSRKASEVQG